MRQGSLMFSGKCTTVCELQHTWTLWHALASIMGPALCQGSDMECSSGLCSVREAEANLACETLPCSEALVAVSRTVKAQLGCGAAQSLAAVPLLQLEPRRFSNAGHSNRAGTDVRHTAGCSEAATCVPACSVSGYVK